MKGYRFKAIWRETGWSEDELVAVADDGTLQDPAVLPQDAAIEQIDGFAIPGFRNAHSHAFQYAMAGLAEHLRAPEDDFWSWREAMYHLALSLDPDQVEDIAALLYAEMLRHGTTAVAEFHYLHHDRDGRAYANPAEMGARLMAAAARVGMRLTLVPIYYRTADFGNKPATPRQRRFLHSDPEHYLRFWEATRDQAHGQTHVTMGLGVHSLRAATPVEVGQLFAAALPGTPCHIHIAEQRREVEACLAAHGRRPVALLAEHLDLGPQHQLVHATHLDQGERELLARSGAVAVICPSTEGNLGDGFFDLRPYLQAGGAIAIGSDSHVGLSSAEDLRWMDYGQRMRLEKRNTVCWSQGEDSGERLFRLALAGGRLALGEPGPPPLTIGAPLDALVLDAQHPLLCETPAAHRLATYLYAGDASFHLGTLVGGTWVVHNGRHPLRAELRARFAKHLRRLGDT